MIEKIYHARYTESAIKQMTKLDHYTAKIIATWIRKNLDGISDPRRIGKPLKDELSQYWRYRVGDYRIIAEIVDYELIIQVVKIGHRRDIYE